MVSFLLTLMSFVRTLIRLFADAEVRPAVVSAAILLAVGTYFYHYVEGWSLLDSLYFCVITLATVGFGDFAPETTPGKIFTIMYVFIGVGLLVGLINIVSAKGAARGKLKQSERGG